MRKHSGNCPICGTWRERLAKDHITPRWKFRDGLVSGNMDDPNNIQYICDNCHADKTSRERKPVSEEQKAATSRRFKGRVFSDETKEKLRAALVGRKFSPERRANISKAHIGKTLSEAHKAAIQAALKGRVFSDEHRARLKSAAAKSTYPRKGVPLSPEHRENIGASLRGRIIGEEHRRRLSAAWTDERRAAHKIAIKAAWEKKKKSR